MRIANMKLGLVLVVAVMFLAIPCWGQSLPSGWQDQDVGAVGVSGSASYSSNVFTIAGAGHSFTYGNTDGFHFAYQQLSGDGSITARVVSETGYAQAGVMIRETLTSGATSMTVLDYSSYLYSAYRTTTSGNVSYSQGSSVSLPYWLQVVRSGSTFSAYVSADGINWAQIGTSQTISMAQNVYIGLAVTSGSTSYTYSATFDNVSVNTSASPAPQIATVSATTGPTGSQVTISGSGFGASQGSSYVLLNGTAVTINSWSNTSITVTIPTGATTGDLIVSVASEMNDSNPVVFTVTSSPLPTGWLDQDVGVVGHQGSGTYSSGVFTVTGGGSNVLSGTTDAFHVVYQPLSGDGTIVARIASVSYSYAQAGLMIRETLSSGAKTSDMLINTSSQINFCYRTSTGGTPSSSNQSASLPYWVELVRSGNSFSAYMAADGVNWVQVGSTQTISMAQNVYVGLFVSSESTSYTYSATFDNVSVSTSSNPAPQITGISATTASAGEQVTISGSGFGASQGSSQVLLNNSAATINSWSATSLTITIPSGATSGYLIVSVAPSMNDSNPIDFTVTSQPLPSDWLDQDIGVVGKAGSSSYASGVFTVTGAGTNITGGTSDAFHFVYQELSGDGTVVARVASVSNSYAQAGVMVRASTSSQSQGTNVMVMTSIVFDVCRTVSGTSNHTVQGASITLPYWVKVVRTGGSLVGYSSPDGSSWTLVAGPTPISMSQSVDIGLFVTSESTSYTYSATFDNVSVTSAATAPPQITGLSATTGSVGSQVVISGTGFGSSQGSSSVMLNNSAATVNSWSSTSITITIPSGATTGYLAVLIAPSMVSSNGVYFTVTSQPLPSPWLDQDVGNFGNRGSATYSSGTFTVQGAGTGVSGQSDGFHFVYQPMTTDGSIIAQVTSETAGAEVGVMIRTSLDANAGEMFSYIVHSGSSTTSYVSYRTFEGNAAVQGGGLGASSPYWLEVSRNANSFSAYISTDGSNWIQVGTTQTLTTAQTVYVGLGISSLSTSTLDSATFASVTLGSGASLPNPTISQISPTSGPPGTVVTISGSGFGSTQGTVQFNGLAATISSWSDSEILAIVPTDADTGPVSITEGGVGCSLSPIFHVVFVANLTDSLGNQTTYTSAVEGGQWQFVASQGPGCSTCSVRGNISNQFDANGNLVSTTDPNGNLTLYAYDSTGDALTQFTPLSGSTAAITTYTYNSLGEVLTVTDPLGHVTTNTYDAHGNLATVTTPAPNGTTGASVTQFTYNSLGELTQITDPKNNLTKLTYTSAGYIATITDPQNNVTTYGYDSRGNRTSVTDALSHQTTFTYDSGNRLTQITYPDSTTASFTYDYRGRRITATDQNGKTTTYGYDDEDRLTSITDAASNVTQYAYDTENNLTSITDANSHETSFAYDAYGRVTQTTFPSNLSETYQYDANSNLTSKTDRKGQTIQYVYDALNRLTQKSYPDSTSVEYTYDLVGKILQVNDPTGTYAFSYDNMGRLIGTTTTYSFLPSVPFSNSYSYDANSNRTGFTAPDSSTNSYTYDTLDQLTGLSNSWAGSFGFSYDAVGRPTQMTRPNNVTTNLGYDNLSRLLSILHQVSGSTIDGAVYALDYSGNRTSKADEYAGVTSNYTYDSIYELTQVKQGTNTTESYSYDPVGNRLSSLGLSPYSYNTSNELTSTSSASYTYDYNGNRTSKTDSTGTTTYAWDYGNRLSGVTLPNSGGTVTFKYDPFGRRIYKSLGSSTSIYVYNADGNLIEETNAGGTSIARYVQTENTLDEPLVVARGGLTSYYEADGQGSITSLTTSSGTIAESYTFDSFGNLAASSGSVTNPFQYTGREFDPETGLYYYRARYYDPANGRFISEDPAGFSSDTFNFYAYVSDNPLVFNDPSGLFKIHGNWCGPGWTGGQNEPFIPAHDKPGFYKPAIDYVDVPCSKHDECYAKCRDKHPCSPLGRIVCFRKCDFGLIGGIAGNPFHRLNATSRPNILNPWSYIVGGGIALYLVPWPGKNGDANSQAHDHNDPNMPHTSCCGQPPKEGVQ
ncbi:MAG TPA: IPT/TIG domain-containing protein [Candidatus Eisenbacteria bacterium]|nr:IPT/TIG domain-containing protein [Candidatus Eisenbacteria bacterium]